MNNEITLRELTPIDWQQFRALRLQALRDHPGVYMSNHAKESLWPDSDWQSTLNGQGKALFGLFDGDQLIGHAAIFTWRGDPTGTTGLMAMDYVAPDYRGRHLTRLFYQARIDWAKNYKPFKRVITGHRDGNEASRRANQAFGFKPTTTEMTTWPDGTQALEYNYELDMETLR